MVHLYVTQPAPADNPEQEVGSGPDLHAPAIAEDFRQLQQVEATLGPGLPLRTSASRHVLMSKQMRRRSIAG